MDKLAQDLLQAAPDDWARLLRDADNETLADASYALGEVATIAAYLARYTQGLSLKRSGCAYSHKKRLLVARRAAKATRKACDYSYPDNHPLMRIDLLAELDD